MQFANVLGAVILTVCLCLPAIAEAQLASQVPNVDGIYSPCRQLFGSIMQQCTGYICDPVTGYPRSVPCPPGPTVCVGGVIVSTPGNPRARYPGCCPTNVCSSLVPDPNQPGAIGSSAPDFGAAGQSASDFDEAGSSSSEFIMDE